LRVSEGERLLYANPAALQTLHAWSLAIGETVPAQISGLASEVLRSGRPVQRDLSVDGRDYLVSIVPIPEVGYANLYWNDVTESKRAGEALRDAHAELADRAGQLESLVRQRTARLNEMVGDLEAFSYSIVHDMRGPLRAMQSFARLLAEDCGPISPTAEDYVNRIERAATRMDRLIQDGLSYSRIMRSDLPLHPTDPGALLRGMLETYPAFQRPNADIEVHDPFPLVQANEAGLTQCVSNFLDNAVKFVADGDTPRVRIWAETRGDKVRLVFKDNGIGIAKGAQDRIFHIFQRLNNAYEGTGIGLAIVKKAAERMGGTVGVESEPGQGSTFWLELPAVGPSPDGDTQGDGAKE
jgi:signal transduction histidine kinase